MNTEQQRQHAEDRRESFEDKRQDAEKQRHISEKTRQDAEKHRELEAQLRDSERRSERLATDYGFNYVLKRIEGVEEQLSQVAARLGHVEALLQALQEQLQQLVNTET